MAVMVITALASTEGSAAAAQEAILNMIDEPQPVLERSQSQSAIESHSQTGYSAEEVVQTLPEDYEEYDPQDAGRPALATANSLAELVKAISTIGPLSEDMRCLAGAIYFESKGEPLHGQLAVGRVIVNRAASNRFPASYCGVVFQRSQFSFIRGGRMPAINTGTRAWRNAVAIAHIADEGSWESPAKGALFFHARYVSPGWRLQRVAQVENHIFYR